MNRDIPNSWETVIGLETHIELSTKSKLFCGCSTAFGAAPNTNVCPVCLAHPGALSNLNRQAVVLAVTAGLMVGCEITRITYMERKHYFYPDLPKAFQATQLKFPLCMGGAIELSSGKTIRLNHIHLEEDAGKLIHEHGRINIDYNRGGVPLIEVVSEADMRSADEAVEYLELLQGLMRTAGVSDCRMQEGSMRCDVNISIRPYGSDTLGTRVEIKNLNSFVSVRQAIEYEYERQVEVLESGGELIQETRGFVDSTGETVSQREKESVGDYRYFRDTDALPLELTDAEIDCIRNELPEPPRERAGRYVSIYALTEADAALLTKYRKVADYYDQAAAINPKLAANLILTHIFAELNTETAREEWNVKASAESFAELISLIDTGKLNRTSAKLVLSRMLKTGEQASAAMESEGLSAEAPKDVDALCAAAVAANPAAVEDYKNGKTKALQSLIGAVMKETKGQAPADVVRRTLEEMLT